MYFLWADISIYGQSSVVFNWVAQWYPTLCDPMNHARQDSLSITISRSSPKLTSIESVMPSSHLIRCCPLLFQPPIPPSIKVFSNESTLRMRWPKYWSFSFSIIPSKEISGLMDWLDLLAVQGTLRILLQHHSSKATNSVVRNKCMHLQTGETCLDPNESPQSQLMEFSRLEYWSG